MKYATLFEWAREVSKQRVKEEKLTMELEKKKKQLWFFQRGGKTITESEEAAISRAIELEFASHDNDEFISSFSKKPPSNSSIYVEFSLQRLSVILEESLATNLQLDLEDIAFSFAKKRER